MGEGSVRFVGFDKAGRLDEHAAGAAGGVEDAAVVGLENFHDEADDGGGGVELAAFLPLGHGELAEEVFVDEPEGVAVFVHGNGGHGLEEGGKGAAFEDLVALREDVGEVRVFLFDEAHGIVDRLPDGRALGQAQEVGKPRLRGQVEDALGVVVVGADFAPTMLRTLTPASPMLRTLTPASPRGRGAGRGVDFLLDGGEANIGVAEEDKAENDGRVFGGLEGGAGPKLVGGVPKLLFKRGVGIVGGSGFGPDHREGGKPYLAGEVRADKLIRAEKCVKGKGGGKRNGKEESGKPGGATTSVPPLRDAFFEVLDEGFEEGGVGVEFGGLGEGFFGELADAFAAGGDAVEAGVGVFGAFGVAAEGFADDGFVAGGVEEVVDDLEGEAEGAADAAHGFVGGGGGVGKGEAHGEGGADEGGGFVEVDEVEVFGCDFGVFGEGVGGLSADEVAAVGGFAEMAGEDGGDLRAGGVGAGENEEGFGEEGVAGEDGGGLVEGDVDGGIAAAQRAVVHGGKVVVHEGVGVEHFHGGGGGRGVGGGGVEVGGGEEEDGAQALAPALDGVAHGRVEAGRAGVGGGQPCVEGALGALAVGFQTFVEFHGGWGTVAGRFR